MPIESLRLNSYDHANAAIHVPSMIEADEIKVYQSVSGLNQWELSNFTSRTEAGGLTFFITDLHTRETIYDFKIVVIGGPNAGDSNVVTTKRLYPF